MKIDPKQVGVCYNVRYMYCAPFRINNGASNIIVGNFRHLLQKRYISKLKIPKMLQDSNIQIILEMGPNACLIFLTHKNK